MLVRPDTFDYLFFADDRAGVLGQQLQNLEPLAGQYDRLVPAIEGCAVKVEPKWTEPFDSGSASRR